MFWKIQVLVLFLFPPNGFQMISVSTAGKDPNCCKIIATMSNGTIKTLCDNKDNVSMSESLSEIMSKKLESESGALESSPSLRLVPNTYKVQQQQPSLHQTAQISDCKCSLLYPDQENFLEVDVLNFFQLEIMVKRLLQKLSMALI